MRTAATWRRRRTVRRPVLKNVIVVACRYTRTGAMDWWAGHIILGEPSDRDRDSEFTATGTCADALEACSAARTRLEAWAPQIAATSALAIQPETQTPLAGDWTVGAALIHIYEELAQHLGHLEITVDLLTHSD